MRRFVILAFCLCPFSADGQGLRGQWDVTSTDPNYSAVLLIDAERRATFDTPNGHGHMLQFRGYVAQDQPGIKMVFTQGTIVMRMYCAAELSARMQCYVANPSGMISVPMFLIRVGPGPATLRPQ